MINVSYCLWLRGIKHPIDYLCPLNHTYVWP
jgi:hypothetical protein